MTMIFMLTGISLILAIGFLSAFLWAVKSGQFEDDYTPSVRMLFDDSVKKIKTNNKTIKGNKNHKQ